MSSFLAVTLLALAVLSRVQGDSLHPIHVVSPPGTYEYTVHVSATKGHAHTGSVIVK